jgi:hypothetical protein
MNEKTFRESMAFLQKLYGKKLETDVYKAYWNLFKGWGDDKFKGIQNEIVKTFVPTNQVPFPVPAHFLSASGESGEHRSRLAVQAVINASNNPGPYRSVSFGDRALHATIERFGGWVEVANWDQEKWQFNERNFIACYEAALTDGGGDRKSVV